MDLARQTVGEHHLQYARFSRTWTVCRERLTRGETEVYGYMAMLQSIELSSDQCLALYMKIPPRDLFICQVYGTALGSIVNFVLIQGVIAAKRPYLDGTLPDPTQQWTGRKPEIFFSASVIFGVLAVSTLEGIL